MKLMAVSAETGFFTIVHSQLRMAIMVVEIAALRHHEKTNQKTLGNTKASLLKDRVMKDPIIADEKHLIILDGAHRVSALQELGFQRILACLLDYGSPSVKLGGWYRTLRTRLEICQRVLDDLNLKYERVKWPVDLQTGDENILMVVGSEREALRIEGYNSTIQAHRLSAVFESELRKRGIHITYATERDAMNKLESGIVSCVLALPTPSKNDVISIAMRGEVFPPKATRHMIPARPLELNLPLTFLRDTGLSVDEANQKICSDLKARSLRHLPGGRFLKGRRYEEDIYVFGR